METVVTPKKTAWLLQRVVLFEGVYYLLTALWPFIDLSSFEAVVGSKPDLFQLYTTSLLILVIGLTLIISYKSLQHPGIRFLSLAAPLAFVVMEVWFWEQLSPAFGIDLVIEVAIIFGLVWLRNLDRVKKY